MPAAVAKFRVLDTCLIANFLRAEQESSATPRYPGLCAAVRDVLRGGTAAVSVVTLYELWRGLEELHRRDPQNTSAGRRRASRTLRFLTSLTPLGLEPNGLQGWRLAAELWAKAKVNGRKLGRDDGDVLIAASTIAHGGVLVTCDVGLAENLRELGYGDHVQFVPLEAPPGSAA